MRKDIGLPPLPIDGWLILVAIRLFGGGLSVFSSIGVAIANNSSEIIILSIINLILIAVTLFYFFKKRIVFKGLYIGAEIFFVLQNLILASIISYGYPQVIAAAIWAAIWITYISLSQRVKKTFVFDSNGDMVYKYDEKTSEEAKECSQTNEDEFKQNDNRFWDDTKADIKNKSFSASNKIEKNILLDKTVLPNSQNDELHDKRQIVRYEDTDDKLQDEFIYCRKCGFKIPLDSDFCYKCGNKVVV